MKMAEAQRIIHQGPKGFMVAFELKFEGMLRSDHFPDKHAGEPLITTEAEAWELAKAFAENMVGKAVNIYVVNHNFAPVPNYKTRYINNR